MEQRTKPSQSRALRRGSRAKRSVVAEVTALAVTHTVLFPGNALPLTELSALPERELKRALKSGRPLVVLTCETIDADGPHGWSTVGTEALITGLLKLPGGEPGVILKGVRRVVVRDLMVQGSRLSATVKPLVELPMGRTNAAVASQLALKNAVSRLLKGDLGIAEDVRKKLEAASEPRLLCDLIVPHLSLTVAEKLTMLNEPDIKARVKRVLQWLTREKALLKLSHEIHDQVSGELSEDTRRTYLKEQVAAIKRELGEMDGVAAGAEVFEEAFETLKLSALAREAYKEELERLNLSSPGSSEYMVAHGYLSLLKDLPWESPCPEPTGLRTARTILNGHHHGLEPVKNRILDYLAVFHHRGDVPGQILLLHGPPGVGKTSLARSVAEALNRPFHKIALGGVKDESEIRGHRRTYIGSMPGKIIQALKQTKSRAPVILLDEIDKVGRERGHDLSAALLEVLDPEQNKEFLDHYLAVPFDTSQVLYVATANDIERIPAPLRDRMEPIEMVSYTEQEKLMIAKRHIIPALRRDMNLSARQFVLSDKTVMALVRRYTRESGVRQLAREIQQLGRKVVRRLVEGRRKRVRAVISPENLHEWLGPQRFLDEPNDAMLPPGVAIGLAYTEVGGELLYVETSASEDDKPGLHLTGNLGKVMQESAQAALSFLRARGSELGVPASLLVRSRIHLHFPDGGTPKDGPSAGIAIMCAMASLVLGKSLPSRLAMTGEITLRGQVLPIGGLREKILAAHRYQKSKILYPAANQSDLADVPADVRARLELIPVATMQDVLVHAGLI